MALVVHAKLGRSRLHCGGLNFVYKQEPSYSGSKKPLFSRANTRMFYGYAHMSLSGPLPFLE